MTEMNSRRMGCLIVLVATLMGILILNKVYKIVKTHTVIGRIH
jgi:hypothetical protein